MSKVTVQLVRGRMEQAREGAARGLLEWAKVADAIGLAAGKGLGQVAFAPPPGVSIKATDCVAELVGKLRAAGFGVTWRDRRDDGDVLNHDLVVSWDGAGLVG